jgi:hypothetical protein
MVCEVVHKEQAMGIFLGFIKFGDEMFTLTDDDAPQQGTESALELLFSLSSLSCFSDDERFHVG